MVDLLRPNAGPRVDRFVVPPVSARASGFHIHRFAVFGFYFRVVVGNQIPPMADKFCQFRKHVVTIGNGEQILREAARMQRQAVPRGKLARRTPPKK